MSKDPYPLERALQIIGSINLNTMSVGEAFYYARKTAEKALQKYHAPEKKMKSQLLEDLNHGQDVPSSNEG